MEVKKMIFGEKIPDKDDPGYKEKHEKTVEAGKNFAKAVKLDKVAMKVQGFASGGVARSIVESVLVLTHDKTKTYFEYIQCIIDSHNKTAIAVKLNDLKHNYERSLKYGFDEQYQKCKKAIAMIQDSLQ